MADSWPNPQVIDRDGDGERIGLGHGGEEIDTLDPDIGQGILPGAVAELRSAAEPQPILPFEVRSLKFEVTGGKGIEQEQAEAAEKGKNIKPGLSQKNTVMRALLPAPIRSHLCATLRKGIEQKQAKDAKGPNRR